MQKNRDGETVNKRSLNPLVVGAAGAALTALAAGTALVLTDKKRRKAATKILNDLGKRGRKLAEKAYDVSEDIGRRIQNVSKKVRESQEGMRHKVRAI